MTKEFIHLHKYNYYKLKKKIKIVEIKFIEFLVLYNIEI